MKVIDLRLLYIFFSIAIVKGDNECGKPGKPIKGYYQVEKDSYNIGETVRYECDSEKYHLKEHPIRECLKNLIWNGSVPFCVQCGDPDLPFKGIFNQKNETEGRLTCEKNYYLRGKSVISCVNRHWNTSGRYCQSLIPTKPVFNKSMRCGDPGIPSNSHFPINNSTENELSYECDKGFVLVGSKERNCEPNGIWSPPLPKCVRNVAMNKTAKLQKNPQKQMAGLSIDGDNATCEPLDNYFNGYIHFQDKVFFDTIQLRFANRNSKEIYVYATNSSNFTTHNFKDYRSLTKIYYNATRLLFLQITNAALQLIEAEYLVIWIRYATEVCEITAYNSKEITECGQSDQPLHGRMLNRDSDVITFECDEGYEIKGDDSIRCVDGVWGNQLPACSPIPTTEPPPESSTSTVTVTNSGTNQSHVESQSSPSTTSPQPESYVAKAIIGIGVGVVVTCVILIAAFCIVKRRRARQSQLRQTLTKSNSQSNNSNSIISEDRKGGNNAIKEDSSNFYESMETSNVAQSKRTADNEDHRKEIVARMNLYRLKHDDSITVENDLYESL